ncbi:plasminogen-like [Mytilus trossulus]|uniref:plasminogen-like n=1 Tax=Mytilus trossulus TaxID=6551 RepID=UPI0030078CBF
MVKLIKFTLCGVCYMVLVVTVFGEIIPIPCMKRQYDLYAYDSLIRRIQPTSLYTCAENCLQMKICKSLNYYKDEWKCELNFGVTTKEKTSVIFVDALDIPMEYAWHCKNHNCTREERCFTDDSFQVLCLPLNIECGSDIEEVPNASWLNGGSLMGNETYYTCENKTVPLPEKCNRQICVNSTATWHLITEVECQPNGNWETASFSCIECFESLSGTKSNTSITLTGQHCQRWDKTSQAQSSKLTPAMFPDDTISAADNYCRSPVTGSDLDRPYFWCMTGDPKMTFDVCSVPMCYTEDPNNHYQQLPDPIHSYTQHFADVPITRFKCYETNSTTILEHCPVSRYENRKWSSVNLSCSDVDCHDPGSAYIGKMTCTVTGRTCQNWNSQTPHVHTTVPDDPKDQTSNYCRNPGDGYSVPWCYTTDPEVKYEYCWIPNC